MNGDSREEAPRAAELDESLLDAKLSVPQPRPGSVSRAAAHRDGSGERLPRGRRHRAGGLRQVDPAGSSGPAPRIVASPGCRSTASTTIPRPCSRLLASAYARVSPGNADLVADMGGLGVSVLGRAAPRLASALQDEPGSVRAHAGRPSRAAVAGLPRRAERGDLGDSPRLAAGRGESFRAAPPAAAAGVG